MKSKFLSRKLSNSGFFSTVSAIQWDVHVPDLQGSQWCSGFESEWLDVQVRRDIRSPDDQKRIQGHTSGKNIRHVNFRFCGMVEVSHPPPQKIWAVGYDVRKNVSPKKSCGGERNELLFLGETFFTAFTYKIL